MQGIHRSMKILSIKFLLRVLGISFLFPLFSYTSVALPSQACRLLLQHGIRFFLVDRSVVQTRPQDTRKGQSAWRESYHPSDLISKKEGVLRDATGSGA